MEKQVILYFSTGAVLSIAAGAFMTAVVYDDHRMDSFGKFLCSMTLFLWPLSLLLLALFGVGMVCAAIDDWMDEHEFCPMTWLFAWPYKLYALVYKRFDAWRFRHKVRKMIETGDTGIVDEDTGIVEEDEE